MSIIFLNDRFIPGDEAAISVTDRGLTLGDGVFDTLLVRDGEPRFAPQHFDRLANHAAVLQIATPQSRDELIKNARKLIDKNDAKTGRYALRTTLSRGQSARGLAPARAIEPTLIMRLSAAPSVPTPAVRATIVEFVRRNHHSPLSRIKSLNYGDNILAAQDARDRGFDDALMINAERNLVCGTMANLFLEKDNRLFTPPLTDGAMDGIMRNKIMEAMDVTEMSIDPSFIAHADAVYLSNSLRGVWPLQTLDDKDFEYKANPLWSALSKNPDFT